jgi:hypothetical protein
MTSCRDKLEPYRGCGVDSVISALLYNTLSYKSIVVQRIYGTTAPPWYGSLCSLSNRCHTTPIGEMTRYVSFDSYINFRPSKRSVSMVKYGRACQIQHERHVSNNNRQKHNKAYNYNGAESESFTCFTSPLCIASGGHGIIEARALTLSYRDICSV